MRPSVLGKTDVVVNWNDAKSIAKAERDKRRFENAGLVPIRTISTIDRAIITYAKPKPESA